MKEPAPLIGADGEAKPLSKKFFSNAERGRPASLPVAKKVRMNFTIDPDLVEPLNAIGNKSAFVNEAVRKALKG